MQEMQETWFRSLGWGDPLEEEMAPHSSIFLPGKFNGKVISLQLIKINGKKKKIQWAQESGGLQSMGPQNQT